jgi:hypothetical protein
VSISRPKGARNRTFQQCDVGRIARECVRDGNGTENEVMLCVAKALGFQKVLAKGGIVGRTAGLSAKLIVERPELAAALGFVRGTGTVVQEQTALRAFISQFSARFLTRIGFLFAAFGSAVLSIWALAFMLEVIREHDVIDVKVFEEENPERKCKCKTF